MKVRPTRLSTGGPVPYRGCLLLEWVLSYSRWTYVSLALSETDEALVAGLRGALWTLGAVPAVLRHDNLSAATHELRRSGGRQLTLRFREVLDRGRRRRSTSSDGCSGRSDGRTGPVRGDSSSSRRGRSGPGRSLANWGQC